MKLYLFFMLLLFTWLTSANAQDKKVSIKAISSSLPLVLKEIQQKAQYNIVYSNDVVTDNILVSIDAVRRPVSEILQSILEPHDLFYSFRESDLILIARRPAPVQRQATAYFTDTLSGLVVGDDDLPVAFATIALLKNDSLLTYMACTEKGRFSSAFPMQPNSTYELSVSSVGYQPAVISFVYPDTAKTNKIKLLRQSNTLTKVIVNASKPMVERKIDRLVFNLANSIATQGTDLTEALKLTPMLKVTENNISIIGKGRVAVMINERIVHLNGASLMSYLKSLRSDDIERIEVITTPPAKYEAQGNGGLINIVLKQNPNLGWSGNVSAAYLQRTYYAYNINANLNYQSRKISSSLKLRDYDGMAIIKEQNDILGSNSILNRVIRKDDASSIGVNLSLNYKVSKNADIGFVYDKGRSSTDTRFDLDATYQTNGLTDSILNTISQNTYRANTQTLNIYYDQKLDSTGKKLSTGVNIFRNTPETNNEFFTISDHSADEQQIKTYSHVKFRVWSAQSDITLPYKFATVEAGAKFNDFNNDADVRYYNFLQQHYVIDNSKSNLFTYIEKNIAGYVSAQKQINKKWTTKAGLRYEHINTEGYSPGNPERNRTSYGKLFPTAYISYKQSPQNTFSLNYSRRIDRPYLRMVNPFRFYSNPYSYFTGNPLLQPSFSHNLELSFLYKGILSFTLYGTRINNGFGDITLVEDGYIITTTANYLTQYSGGIIVTFNKKLLPWWENSSYASFNVSDSRSSIPTMAVRHGSGFNYSVNNTFKLSKAVSAFLNYSQSLPSTQGNMYTYSQYSLTSGLRATVLSSKLQLGLSLFKGSLVRYRGFYKDFERYINTNYDYRTLTLSANYSFGKKKVRGNTKNINFGEKQRAN